MSETPSDDHLMQAFLYASGELSADEESAFEDRLAVDQELRETLSRVVSTASAVQVVETTVSPVRSAARHDAVARTAGRTVSLARWGALLAVAVAGLLVVVSVWPSAERPEEVVVENDPAESGDRESDLAHDEDVLALWADSAERIDEGDELLSESPLGLGGLGGSLEGEREFEVPEWMFAAVEPERMDEMMDESGMPRPETVDN